MYYFFKEGHELSKKFILFHGTGGNENSLVKLAYYFDPDATILSFRGNVEENGKYRFFNRFASNQFDYKSLEEESNRLVTKIYSVSQEERIAVEEWIILGYSNGGNIAAHILLERESLVQQAILFHPMSLGIDTQTFPITSKKIWLSIGTKDPLVSEESALKLVDQFKNRGAQIDTYYTDSDHKVTMDELATAKRWLATY